MFTIYPPLAQIVFLLNALLGGTILGLKVVWVGLDLVTALLLGRVASRSGRDPRWVLTLYLWSPLLIIETAWNGHLEALGLVFIALLLYFRRPPGARGQWPWPWPRVAKFAPAAALPPLWRRYGWRMVLALGVTLAVLYLPYVSAGTDAVGRPVLHSPSTGDSRRGPSRSWSGSFPAPWRPVWWRG